MNIRHIMTTNVVTIPSDTSMMDARRIMEAHRIRRLPIVDRGKLVGLVNRDALDRAGPSQLSTFSIHEMTYLLSKLTVKEVMARDLVTISPDATWEQAVQLAQSRKVGALLVVEEHDKLVGIVTTNDFFYKIINPVLGIGVPGARIHVHNCGGAAKVAEVLNVIAAAGMDIEGMFIVPHPEEHSPELTIHLTSEDPAKAIEQLTSRGFLAHPRER